MAYLFVQRHVCWRQESFPGTNLDDRPDSSVESENDQVLTLVPDAAMFKPKVSNEFTVHLWNPLSKPVETGLIANIAVKQGKEWQIAGGMSLSPEQPVLDEIEVPPRAVKTAVFRRA